MTKIEVLGSGCAKCKQLARNVEQALLELGMRRKVAKIEDIHEIVSRGVMMTPALYVDGEAKAVGRVPSVHEIKRMLG